MCFCYLTCHEKHVPDDVIFLFLGSRIRRKPKIYETRPVVNRGKSSTIEITRRQVTIIKICTFRHVFVRHDFCQYITMILLEFGGIFSNNILIRSIEISFRSGGYSRRYQCRRWRDHNAKEID